MRHTIRNIESLVAEAVAAAFSAVESGHRSAATTLLNLRPADAIHIANSVASSISWVERAHTGSAEVPLRDRRTASEVDHVAGETVNGLFDRFAHRRVNVDVMGHVFCKEVVHLGEGELGQQLAHVVTNQVSSK